MADRHTRLSETKGLPVLSAAEIAELEAENGLLQFDRMIELIEEAVRSGASFKLKPSAVLGLQRIAVEGLEPTAGTFRTVDVEISGTRHVPPSWQEVPSLVEAMCEYLDESWGEASALHLAAYAMWRLNWIHPFTNGNGRTARVISYLLLCARLGYVLPGSKTIPEMIATDKQDYYQALDSADARWETGTLDVSAMESLLKGYLASQLLEVVQRAEGG